jgi:hypothetical protein
MIMKYTSTFLLSGLLLSLVFFSCEENTTSSEIVEDSETEAVEQEVESPTLQIGQDIANQTQATLGRNLMQAINTGGTEYAIPFCSEKAVFLTDSMALSLNATVKRVSDKNRNPNNAANEEELAYIIEAKELLANGENPKGAIKSVGNREIGYYPILSNQMCMQCHGKPDSDISPETLSKINTLYPNDLATGYSPNELRGIWVVEMDKQ